MDWVRAIATVYLCLSIFVTYLLWKNSGADIAITQIATLFGALLLALVAVVPFLNLKPEQKQALISVVLFRDRQTNMLVAGAPTGPYLRAYQSGFVGNTVLQLSGPVENVPFHVPEESEPDIVERLVAQRIIEFFSSSNWASELVPTSSIYGTGDTSKISLPSDAPSRKLSADDLARVYRHNSLINKDSLIYAELNIPADVKVTAKKEGIFRSISFENDEFQINVVIFGHSSFGLPNGLWGVFKGDPAFGGRYQASRYNIFVQGITKRFVRYPALTKDYWRWFENFKVALAPIDWPSIDAQLEKKYSRDSSWSDVEQDFRANIQRVERMLREAENGPPRQN